jgi:pimeloyl-ACP methyl ester carboxylesterase
MSRTGDVGSETKHHNSGDRHDLKCKYDAGRDCSGSRRIRRWVGLGRCLPDPQKGRLSRQHRTESDDISRRRCSRDQRVIAEQKGPVILVGHSYGGAVITEAGNDPSVEGLVYITAFAPDRGESVASLIKDPPPGAPVPPILPPTDGFLALDNAKFAASFAADVPAEKADFMANSQVPWGLAALNGAVTEPAWATKPSWYLVATDDRMIPPPAQRAMSKRAGSSVVEAKGSHAIYVSQPEAVAEIIKTAAKSLSMK